MLSIFIVSLNSLFVIFSHFLRRLRSFDLSQALMVKFYRAVIESVLTFLFAVRYSGATGTMTGNHLSTDGSTLVVIQ